MQSRQELILDMDEDEAGVEHGDGGGNAHHVSHEVDQDLGTNPRASTWMHNMNQNEQE